MGAVQVNHVVTNPLGIGCRMRKMVYKLVDFTPF
jgi:hypothetical protein